MKQHVGSSAGELFFPFLHFSFREKGHDYDVQRFTKGTAGAC